MKRRNNISVSLDTVDRVRQIRNAQGDITLEGMPDVFKELPGVSILTVTKNRKHLFDLPIHNWKKISYPPELLEWIIIDNSDDNELESIINKLEDKRIKYTFCNNAEGMTIGKQRNIAVTKASNDYLVNMDDDDFMFPDSVLVRTFLLKSRNKGCVFTDELGIYNLIRETSYTIQGERVGDIAEGSMAFTRAYWHKYPFKNESASEGRDFLKSLDALIIIPFFFNIVAINHTSNITGRLRSFRIGDISKMTSKTKVMDYNLFFDPETKTILDKIRQTILKW